MTDVNPQAPRKKPEEPYPIPKKQAHITFAIVSLALLMASIDSTIVAVSLPAMLGDLKTNLALVGWTLTGYQFSQSIVMPIAGKLSDDLGRKRLFMISVLVFTLSSAAAGLAPNIGTLIGFRVIQGIGGGGFMPSATGIICDAFGSRRNTAIGLFGSIFPIGGILGPNLGGFFVDNFSWRWIFYVNVPIGILLLVLGTIILPKSGKVSVKGRIDTFGAGLFCGAILAILYGITAWANNGGNLEAQTPILFAAGIVLLYFFVRHENRVDEPMIDIKLLRWRPFLAVNIYNFIFGAVVFGLFAFIPYYATMGYGMTAMEDGLILTPRSLAMIIFSGLTSIFIIKSRYRMPMVVGLIFMAISLFLLSRGYHDVNILGLDLRDLPLLASFVSIAGIGFGLANPAANNAALDLIPEKVAAVAGLRGMFRITGGSMGTAIVTLILSYFTDQAVGMQLIFLVLAILLLLLIPIVYLIPDSARERRARLYIEHRE